MEEFNFETGSLDYSTIENTICKHYDMGWAESSDFTEIEPNRFGQSVTIITTKGSIACYISAYPKIDNKDYIVYVNSVSIKRKYR